MLKKSDDMILLSEDIVNMLPKSCDTPFVVYDNIAFSCNKFEDYYFIYLYGHSSNYISYQIVIDHIYNYLKQIERNLKLNLIC
jgi:hypothetical protein